MQIWRAVRTLPSWTIPAIIGVLIILVPFLGLDYAQVRQIELALVLSLVTSGLNLSLGYAGELALGQAAMYAAGAYAGARLSVSGHTDLLLQLVVAAAVALVVGLVTGIPGLRLGSWSLAMTSFFLILIVPDVLSMFPDQTGGRNGLVGIQPPTVFGQALGANGLAVAIGVVSVVWFWVMRNIVTSSFGTRFRILKQSPVLASSMGIPVYRMKLLAYGLGSIPAGLGGALFANIDLFVAPDSFDFHTVTTLLAASILGGSTSVYGAAVGSFIMQFGPNQSNAFQQYSLIFSGAFLLVGGLLLKGGLARLGKLAVRRLDQSAHITPPDSIAPEVLPDPEPVAGSALVIEGVSKAFGGNRALSDVTFTAKPGHVTALIGPNGSGKTTLLNMVCGFYRADGGTISLGGKPLPTRHPHEVARAGVSRTFQTPNIPEGMTVLEVVRSGRSARERVGLVPAVLRLPSYRRARESDRGEAWRLLELVGLEGHAADEAISLPLGMRRLLEVARCLASGAGVLMLDEVASGLDEHEVPRLTNIIRGIRDTGGTIVLVEHNFELIMGLADEVVALAHGQVIAHGNPSEVAANEQVRREYLGAAASTVGQA
ncbi:amino acid/amide ABC transporter membrane protein 2 (HAAT family) /amino acid/amide ABC transporter ATP-binding protein 1 (HAAT family) [Branchiibius hedensis]|uniref:Amino acid/amide ABC transporter membrane protein 2, HAAT family /amino acid/amide ABC transporter ATP-binding protein 1, HAAT family n=1 Tax=Branchiibius hedensis TaxID=672460 RepID=A0A2Y9A039_9MICO|nr:branched-chain amino acid ABC transporter ATP-binding protein/permease [Branchiibius hedensis]PWJ27068.1 amino acid/amide ABC transporter membrane protein 2 (HAAT family) /amino acid/amide ABC transporter ATP-binding protein 1 (HAAT family) [Branchiibius hedensis]SSA35879.1 amino acid/amide ABC transporter membrane protein 2, HAAT family /amino acid/amide ABC transporter ATP-binding protein 1, HAAT family [Branchiibius hedensis]